MLIEAISLRGYCRTFRPPRPASLGKRIGNTAFEPAMRITKLTTIASTGRLMKRSVKDFMRLFRHSTFALRHSHYVSAGFGFNSGFGAEDRKSTRLNSSHGSISYAVFCLKKKKK